jgi:protein SCO1/2
MNTPRWLHLALGATTGLLALLLVMGPPGGRRAGGDAEGRGLFLAEPLSPPALDLVGHDGQRVRLEGYRGRPVAVFFGYTHCPDVCPVTLAHLSRLLDELGPVEALVGAPHEVPLVVLFVTVDPERDTRLRLARYLEAFHASIVGVTGPESEIRAQAFGFGVGITVADHEPGEPYLVDHTARTFLLDREGRVVAQLPATVTFAELTRAAEALIASGGAGG